EAVALEEQRVEQRYVDVLALASAIAVANGRQGTNDGVERGQVIGEERRSLGGLPPAFAVERHPPAGRLGDRVVARPVATRAGLAPRRNRDVHDGGIAASAGVEPNTQTVEGAGAEVLDHDVCRRHQIEKAA